MSKSREIIFGDDENVYLSRKRTIEPMAEISKKHDNDRLVMDQMWLILAWLEEKAND